MTQADREPFEDLVEPVDISTETMARLYEAQGFYEDAVRARQAFFAKGQWSLVEMGDEVLDEIGLALDLDGSMITCRWRLSEEIVDTLRTAMPEALLAAKGADIALRVATVRGPVTSFWDLHPLREQGSCRIQSSEPVDAVLIAVGIRSGTGRFVPAFHQGPLEVGGS